MGDNHVTVPSGQVKEVPCEGMSRTPSLDWSTGEGREQTGLPRGSDQNS